MTSCCKKPIIDVLKEDKDLVFTTKLRRMFLLKETANTTSTTTTATMFGTTSFMTGVQFNL